MLRSRLIPAALLSAAVLVPAAAARAVDPVVLAAQQQRMDVTHKIAPTVVAIFGPDGGGGGSGVLISPDGYALTNYHVTSGAGDYMKCGLNDGKLYDALIVGEDPTGDVALIKLMGRDDFPVAELGDSDTVQMGDWVYAVGNPFLLATDFQPTFTYGIVSGTHRYQYPAGTFLEYTDCIQVDASINPGNSGGPLFNAQGQVIGINGRGSFEKRGRVNVGAGYAISINQVKHFMDHLRSGRVVDHATLGAVVASQDDGSVIVSDILEDSDAYRRGLRVGDEIVSFAGRPIRSVNQFKNVLGIYPKGWKLPLVYRRDGQRYETAIRLPALHTRSELTPEQQGPQAPMPPEGPGDKPGQPGDDPEKKPGQPPQMPHAMMRKPQIPDKYKDMLVRKPGFSNYYFNEQEQERLLKSLEDLGDYDRLAGPWTLTGKTKTGEPFTIRLTDQQAELTLAEKTWTQPLDGAEFQDLPPNSGGLLTALHQLRLLLTGGKQPFSEFYYLGSEPLDGGLGGAAVIVTDDGRVVAAPAETTGRRVDVLVTTLTGVESRWYFDRQTGELAGFDTRLSENADPAEVRFAGWGTVEGRRFPTLLQVRHAGRDVAELMIEKTDLGSGK